MNKFAEEQDTRKKIDLNTVPVQDTYFSPEQRPPSRKSDMSPEAVPAEADQTQASDLVAQPEADLPEEPAERNANVVVPAAIAGLVLVVLFSSM